MAQSSDEIIKREIVDYVGSIAGPYSARVFSEGSNDDQRLFKDGGLTFSHEGQDYGSCDVVYVEHSGGQDKAIVAIEGTDCLNRGSSGNAQYQRFHHALGAVKNGIIGIYYLREGNFKVQPDLYGMAKNISDYYHTPYLIVQDLEVIKKILSLKILSQDKLNEYIENYQKKSYQIFLDSFKDRYKNSFEIFADKRSTIIFDKYIIKYSSRNVRNFTDSQLRGGHIAVGEMFLTKSFFPSKKIFYLWPRMTNDELRHLDDVKSNDKEWSLLRNEPNVEIKTLDDLVNVPADLKHFFYFHRNDGLKSELKTKWNACAKKLQHLLKNKEILLKQNID